MKVGSRSTWAGESSRVTMDGLASAVAVAFLAMKDTSASRVAAFSRVMMMDRSGLMVASSSRAMLVSAVAMTSQAKEGSRRWVVVSVFRATVGFQELAGADGGPCACSNMYHWGQWHLEVQSSLLCAASRAPWPHSCRGGGPEMHTQPMHCSNAYLIDWEDIDLSDGKSHSRQSTSGGAGMALLRNGPVSTVGQSGNSL